MKEAIILINPTNFDPPPNYFGPPYGISLIGAVLLKTGRPVRVYDFDFEPVDVMLSSVAKAIEQDKPRYIGIAVQSCNRGAVYELVEEIKKVDKSVITILGGPFASIKYELLLKNFPVDYVVIGDGEKTLSGLLDCLDEQGDQRKVNGIAFRDGRDICVTVERKKEINLDSLPYPAFELFKGFDERINSAGAGKEGIPNFILGRRCTTLKNALMLLSSRGCIYNCNFCPMSQVRKNKIRFHSPRYFIDMVEYFYKKYRIKNYVFGDNTFTLIRKRAMDICEGIMRRKLQIKWSCMTRSDYVDSELLKKMAQAGCFEISYGVESGSSRIQKIIRKNLDLVKTKKAFAMTKKAGIRSILMLMAGNQGENEDTIKETISYIKDIEPDFMLVKILKVYPGTDIHDIFEKKGLLKKDYYLTSEFNPPSFTCEHSESELEKFSRMLSTRRVFIQTNNTCNNNCLFCRLNRRVSYKKTNEIKKNLILASSRGEHIVLYGGEIFLRKDIFQILEYADELGIHHLYIYSNGRIFFYRNTVEKLKDYQSLRAIIMPFFGFSPVHDEIVRVKNAFWQTMEGLKNLRTVSQAIKIHADIFISQSNYKSMLELVELLLDSGISEFRFIFGRDSMNLIEIADVQLPPMNAVAGYLRKIAGYLKRARTKFFFEGFPVCVLGKYKAYISEPYYLFNELISFEDRVVNCRRARIDNKVKFKFCANCKENNLCEGVWKKYHRIHGESEFKSC